MASRMVDSACLSPVGGGREGGGGGGGGGGGVGGGGGGGGGGKGRSGPSIYVSWRSVEAIARHLPVRDKHIWPGR